MVTMTLKIWKLTRTAEGRPGGFDVWFCPTRFSSEEDELGEALADMAEGETMVTREKILEIPEYDVPAIADILSLYVPPAAIQESA